MSNENDEIDAVKIAFDKWYNTQGWDQWDYELIQFSAEFVMEFAEQYATSRISELEAENEKNIKWANDAETRAVAAEERIAELEAEKEKLEDEKDELELVIRHIPTQPDLEAFIDRLKKREKELEAENKKLKEDFAASERLRAADAASALDRENALRAENKRLREEHRWIPVTERLPGEESKWYLCYTPHFEDDPLITCFYADGKWYEESFDITKYVTHWTLILPIPKEQ